MRVLKSVAALLALVASAPGGLAAQEGRGDAPRGFLGIGFVWQEDTPREARVGSVVRGSAAEQAGVRRGDVILRIDGQPASEEAVDRMRQRLSPGDTVRLRLRRDGRELDQAVVAGRSPGGRVVVLDDDEEGDITVRVPTAEARRRVDSVRVHVERLLTRMDSLHGRLEVLHGDSVLFRVERDGPRAGRRRENRVFFRDSLRGRVDSIIVFRDSVLTGRGRRELLEALPFTDLDPDVPFLLEMGRRGVAGAELAEMNAGLARYFRTERGVLVLRVSENTPMARAGVEAGDVIVRAGGAEMRDVADLRRAFGGAGAEGRLALEVLREGRTRTVQLQWEPGRWRVRSTAPGTPEPRQQQRRQRLN